MKSSDPAASTILLLLKQMARNLTSGASPHDARQPSLQSEEASKESTHRNVAHPDALSLKALVELIDSELLRVRQLLQGDASSAHPALSPDQIETMTINQMLELHEVIEGLAVEFNATLADHPELEGLHITTARFMEPDSPEAGSPLAANHQYRRCRATSQSWSLVLRGSAGFIDVFLMPSHYLLSMPLSETDARLKVSLKLDVFSPVENWELDLFSTHPNEKTLLMKALFKELVLKSAHQMFIALEQIEPKERSAEMSTMEELFLAKQNMAQKLVSRHEELTHAIARDLHDVVIAEVMLLKRALANHNLLEDEEIGESLETLSTRLREICYDLAPRDLEDWGLKTIVEDLLERISKRTGTAYSLEYLEGLPKIGLPVQLHIYRIIQECLNNIAKYANATKIEVKFALSKGQLLVTIADNGTGFAASADRARGLFERGMGLSTINERTEMIRCFHPAKLAINSDPGRGTVVTLQIGIFEA
jgi:signal transduction histidine kinase